jgi:hypothetical protein
MFKYLPQNFKFWKILYFTNNTRKILSRLSTTQSVLSITESWFFVVVMCGSSEIRVPTKIRDRDICDVKQKKNRMKIIRL